MRALLSGERRTSSVSAHAWASQLCRLRASGPIVAGPRVEDVVAQEARRRQLPSWPQQRAQDSAQLVQQRGSQGRGAAQHVALHTLGWGTAAQTTRAPLGGGVAPPPCHVAMFWSHSDTWQRQPDVGARCTTPAGAQQRCRDMTTYADARTTGGAGQACVKGMQLLQHAEQQLACHAAILFLACMRELMHSTVDDVPAALMRCPTCCS